MLLVESGNQAIWVVESGIPGFRIPNTAQGIRNLTKDWNLPRVLNPDSVRINQAKIDTLFKAQTLKANPIQGEKCKNLIATHKPSFIRFPNILRDGSVT